MGAVERENLGLLQIAMHHEDVIDSLVEFFHGGSPSFLRRYEYSTPNEVLDSLNDRIYEAELSSCLTILAAIEAAFRVDYLERASRRKKDNLSRAFKRLYAEKAERASLESDVFQGWLDNTNVPNRLISELRGAFKLRHWLAHGRYWRPNLGRRYTYDYVYQLASDTFGAFDFFE